MAYNTRIKSKQKLNNSNIPRNKRKKEHRILIIRERCKGCGLCVLFCPNDVLELSSEKIENGKILPVVKYPEHCTGCNKCFKFCPDFAIYSMIINKNRNSNRLKYETKKETKTDK